MAWANGYSYRRTLTVDHTKCGTEDSANFPHLFSRTLDYLAHTDHGGKVTSNSGFDIILTSDAAGATKLDHEIESYVHTSGLCIFQVRIPTLGYAADTVVYLFYGNSSVTTSQENKTGTWNANFMGVWHLNEAQGAGTFVDSTSNANNGSDKGNTPTAVTGQIAGGQTFEIWGNWGSIVVPADATLNLSTYTLSMWVKAVDAGGWTFLMAKAGYLNYTIYRAGNDLVLYDNNATNDTLATFTAGNWHHFVLVENGGTLYPYLDGVAQTTRSRTSHFSTNGAFTLGVNTGGSCPGATDEARLSDSVRTASWILSEYNNQSSPSTFYSLGAEENGSFSSPFPCFFRA
jgi:hypothetical protein